MFINMPCVIGTRGSTTSLQSGMEALIDIISIMVVMVSHIQDTDVPKLGFSHSIKLDVTTAIVMVVIEVGLVKS